MEYNEVQNKMHLMPTELYHFLYDLADIIHVITPEDILFWAHQLTVMLHILNSVAQQ